MGDLLINQQIVLNSSPSMIPRCRGRKELKPNSESDELLSELTPRTNTITIAKPFNCLEFEFEAYDLGMPNITYYDVSKGNLAVAFGEERC